MQKQSTITIPPSLRTGPMCEMKTPRVSTQGLSTLTKEEESEYVSVYPSAIHADDKTRDSKDQKEVKSDVSTADKALILLGSLRGLGAPASLMTSVVRRGMANSAGEQNRIYEFLISDQLTFTANGSGVTAASGRFGDPSIWTGYSTLNALFSRFRVKHVEYWITPASGNAGSGGTGTVFQQLVAVCDVATNSLTLSSTQVAWAHPGSTLVSVPSFPQSGPCHRTPSCISKKVVPEKAWFDLSSELQQGCFALYGTNATVSGDSFIVYCRYRVEFQGLIL